MKVYLSSTLNDLGPERQAVKEALGGECTVVESYVADERSVRESCVADVGGCDLYIGIVGLRYGFVPPGQSCSITHLEYLEAKRLGRPTLVFVKDPAAIAAPFTDAYTKQHPPERIESFRNELSGGTESAGRPALFQTPQDLKAHVLKAYLRLSQRQPSPAPKLIEGRPYPGLRAFLPTEADRFFGRDAEVELLLERLLARGERFLALIGASGSGKSSLVYAGLIPKLTASPVVAGSRWLPVTFSPRQLGDDPFLPLAAALVAAVPGAGWRAADLARSLRELPADVAAVAAQALGGDGTQGQVLLFVDQFEELFAAKVDDAVRAAFFALLAASVACPSVRVVIAMRSDFYAQWPQDEASFTLLRDGHFPVALPGAAALEKMIVGPANAAGLVFEPPRLVQRILDETGSGPGALALAEFALAQLYDRRHGYALTEAAYEGIGGVAGAIEGLAEEAVRRAERALTDSAHALDEEAWSRFFVAIASVEVKGQDLAVVRRRATASDLPGAALTLAQHLVDKRLLVSSGGGSTERPALYEVGHEALFSQWGRFKDWYARHADNLAARRHVERAASDWHNAGRPPYLRWHWERQKPVLEALRKLEHLAPPPRDPEFADVSLALWRTLGPRLPEPPLRSFLHPEPLALLEELRSDATPHQRREEIGLRLAQMGDPRFGVGLGADGLPEFDWVDVPQGRVTLEDGEGVFDVQPFRLARYPVTWAQYRVFLDAVDGYRRESWWQGRPRDNEPGEPRWAFANYPAIRVSWYDAMACCGWLSARFGFEVRLPNEWEWQQAATAGSPNNEYPWPGVWNAARVNSAGAGIGRTTAVGMYPLGRSPFGIDDMAGNVWEWCLNTKDDPRSNSVTGDSSRVLRGGSWNSRAKSLRVAARYDNVPGFRCDLVGFRVCRGSPIE